MSESSSPFSEYFVLIYLVTYLYPGSADTAIAASKTTVVLIQGLPCDDLIDNEVIGEDDVRTSWPQACDHLCSHTEGCQSFTWSRRDSKCRLLRQPTLHSDDCYQKSEHEFWFLKDFAANRHLFTPYSNSYVTLTMGNRYGSVHSEEQASLVCHRNNSLMTWEHAKRYCESRDLVMFEPKNVTDVINGYWCSDGLMRNLWTGYRWNGIAVDGQDILAFTGESYAMLR